MLVSCRISRPGSTSVVVCSRFHSGWLRSLDPPRLRVDGNNTTTQQRWQQVLTNCTMVKTDYQDIKVEVDGEIGIITVSPNDARC